MTSDCIAFVSSYALLLLLDVPDAVKVAMHG